MHRTTVLYRITCLMKRFPGRCFRLLKQKQRGLLCIQKEQVLFGTSCIESDVAHKSYAKQNLLVLPQDSSVKPLKLQRRCIKQLFLPIILIICKTKYHSMDPKNHVVGLRSHFSCPACVFSCTENPVLKCKRISKVVCDTALCLSLRENPTGHTRLWLCVA